MIEALIRLSLEDLVVTLSDRSTIVAPIEIVTFPAYVEAQDISQRMNSRLAAELRTETDLNTTASRQRKFEAAVKSGDHLAMSEANNDFHMAIAHAGRSGANPYPTTSTLIRKTPGWGSEPSSNLLPVTSQKCAKSLGAPGSVASTSRMSPGCNSLMSLRAFKTGIGHLRPRASNWRIMRSLLRQRRPAFRGAPARFPTSWHRR
jgi:hypothetical protein